MGRGAGDARDDRRRRDPGVCGGAARPPAPDADDRLVDGPAELRAAFHLTLDAINFGSGWFPTLRKRDGRSGYWTVALGLRDRFAAHGAWTAAELRTLDPRRGRRDARPGSRPRADGAVRPLAQRPRRARRRRARRPLPRGRRTRPTAPPSRSPSGSRAGTASPTPRPTHGRRIPFFKRAQIAASDLHHAGVADFADDLHRLTLFADNLVPHVLRLDGILRFDPASPRASSEQLIAHDSPEEVEMRACAVHAVELIVRERADLTAQQVDHLLWTKGGGARYKAARARAAAAPLIESSNV